MKMKYIGLNALFYFLYAFGSALIVMLVEWLLVFIIQRFVIVPYPILTVIRTVIYTGGVLAILAGMGYIEGYRDGFCNIGESIVGGVLGAIFHLLFALLFHFDPFVTAGVRFAAGLIQFGGTITDQELLYESSTVLRLGIFAAYTALYIAVLILTRCIGAHRRLTSRAELGITTAETTEET